MFLEETIESLDTEEDSGLSNDESDQLPGSGNLAIKLADLSASISKSKLNGELISEDRCSVSSTAVSRTLCLFVFQVHMPLKDLRRKMLTSNLYRDTWFLHLLLWQMALHVLYPTLDHVL